MPYSIDVISTLSHFHVQYIKLSVWNEVIPTRTLRFMVERAGEDSLFRNVTTTATHNTAYICQFMLSFADIS